MKSFSGFFYKIKQAEPEIIFSILEVGARPIGEAEPFYQLVTEFPGSRVNAIEVNKEFCEELNKTAPAGIHYFPEPLGDGVQTERTLFDTMHPMCSSLYAPNENFLKMYNNLDVMKLKECFTVDTIGLDQFVEKHAITPIDFIKIDIQGAELDVFRGGLNALKNVLSIVTEAEFVPLYEGQPLYGDLVAFLSEQNFMHHKFVGMGGRTLRPFPAKDLNAMSQQMWSDVMFIRDIQKVRLLTRQQVVKLGVLAMLYGSIDLAFFCFGFYFQATGIPLHTDFLAWVAKSE